MFPIRHFESRQRSLRREELGERARKIDSARISVSTSGARVLCNVYIYDLLYFGILASAFENCVPNNFNLLDNFNSSTTRWSKGRKIRTPQAYIFNLLVLVSLTLVALHWEMTDWRIVSDVPENYDFSEILWSTRNRFLRYKRYKSKIWRTIR